VIVCMIHIISLLSCIVKKIHNFIQKSTRGPAEDPTNV
jgi:hypothetical protein